MKIAMHSSYGMKFMQDLRSHWEQKGHLVFYEPGANPRLAEECDLTYIDAIDNNFYCLFNGPSNKDGEYQVKHYPKKRIAVRAIDIDVWMGRHRDPRIWEYMDDLITICDYHFDKINNEGNPPKEKHHLIRPGVNLNRFTFREKKMEYKIAMVTGDFWEMKNYMEGIRIFDSVCRKYPSFSWTLHIRGQHNSRDLERICKEHLIDSMGIRNKIAVYGHVSDMNQWYESMDFILVPSMKEAFSYATGEAMSKGIKPILNNWLGSTTIWPEKYIYNHFDEAVEMFVGEYKPEEYRQVIQDKYDVKRMLKEYDDLFGT